MTAAATAAATSTAILQVCGRSATAFSNRPQP
eukprot:CAMPEP_0119395764 /NCGR_PEP_ID=MMETSP1334-20130426/134469_1 /TAXON_ID=127549 /ORGANISM="Calcidiscus leptoporus, Strain RCC1130" /LENGTH=31 /DNA_ID= /DNA_START= /DNA_END= /DNA_ORIENTATION=